MAKVKLETALKASYGYEKEMKKLNKKGFILDKELSNHNEQVYYKHKKSGGKKLLYNIAGTHNLSDVGTDISLGLGRLKNTNRYKEADDILRKAKEKHRVNKASIAGHSLGGSIAGYIAGNNDNVFTLDKGATIGQKLKSSENAYRHSGDVVSLLNANSKHMKTIRSHNKMERYNDLLNNTLAASHSGYLLGPAKSLLNIPRNILHNHNIDRIQKENIYI